MSPLKPDARANQDRKEIINDSFRQIEFDFSKLSDTLATRIFHTRAKKYFERARNGEMPTEEELFLASVSLIHAKAYDGKLPEAVSIGNGFYIKSADGWDKHEFAIQAVPAFCQSYKDAKERIPTEIRDKILTLDKDYYEKYNGIEHTQENIDFMENKRPIVAPFDHFHSGALLQKEGHYPHDFQSRVFGFLKITIYPPTLWYSAREENDLPKYVGKECQDSGKSMPEIIRRHAFHEASHGLAINPALFFNLKGSMSCWIAEGVAKYFEADGNASRNFKKISEIKPIEQIADKIVGPEDYYQSLLLVMALAAKFGGGSEKEQLEKGIIKIVSDLVDRAHLVIAGKEEKAENSLELLYIVDPSLKEPEELQKLQKLMREIKEKFA